MKAIDKKFAALLLKHGEITEEQLLRAVETHDPNTPLTDHLLKLCIITETAALRVQAEHNGYEFVQLREVVAEPEALKLVTADLAWKMPLLAFGIKAGQIHVALAEGTNLFAQDELKLMLGRPVTVFIAQRGDLQAAIQRYYGPAPEQSTRLSAADFRKLRPEDLLGDPTESQRISRPVSLPSQTQIALPKETVAPNTADVPGILAALETERQKRGAYAAPSAFLLGERSDGLTAAQLSAPSHLLANLMNTVIDAGAAELELVPMESGVRVRQRTAKGWEPLTPYALEIHSSIIGRLRLIAGAELRPRDLTVEQRFLYPGPHADLLCTLHLEHTFHGDRALIRLSERQPLLLNPMAELRLNDEALSGLSSRLDGQAGGLLLLTGPSTRVLQQLYYSFLRWLGRLGPRDVLSLEYNHERRVPNVTAIACPTETVLLASLANATFMNPDAIGVSSIGSSAALNLLLATACKGTTAIGCLNAATPSAARHAIRAAGWDPVNMARGISAHLHVEEVRLLCLACRKPLTDIDLVPTKARTLAESFHEAPGCDRCQGTGRRGTGFLIDAFIPDGEKADGSFRQIQARDGEVRRLLSRGDIDPRCIASFTTA